MEHEQMKAENLAATGQDWANYISHELDSNGMIYLAAFLNGQPDLDLLKQAVMESIELQPVLGCRFDLGQDPPVWTPIGEYTPWFSVIEADTWQDGLAAFLREKPGKGQLAVRLIKCPGQTALCLRMDHAAADGAGAKKYLALLCRLFGALAAGRKLPGNIPQDRPEMQVFAAAGIDDFRKALRRESPAPVPFVTFPYQDADAQEVRYAWITFPLAEIKAVPGCTVNDLLLAACARALACETDKEQSVVLNMTVDLRRYLKEEDVPAACNLSGMEKVCFTVAPGEAFAETAGKAARETAAVKAGHPGLSSAAAMAYLRLMPFEKARTFLLDASRKAKAAGIAAPIVSNLGWLHNGEMRFGDVNVTDILPLTPAMHAPAFMIGAGSYRDKMTLSVGYFESERDVQSINRFLQRVMEELTGEGRY
jgi:NRPS condensation-like uncharacterized protein